MPREHSLRSLWVRLGFSAQMAWRGVSANRLRSVLTVLSVVIGVGSVVSLMAIGEGARQTVVGQIGSLGENVIVIQSEDPSVVFRPDLAEELEQRVSSLECATPVINVEVVARWRRTRGTADILGVNEHFPAIRDHTIVSGNFFTDLHVEQRSRVAVLGYAYGTGLMEGRSPVGNSITLDGRSFRIIGVLAPKGEGKADGIDNRVVVPYTVAQEMAKKRAVDQIWGKAVSAEEADLAVAQLSRLFLREIGLDPTAPSPTGGGGKGPEGEEQPPGEPIPDAPEETKKATFAQSPEPGIEEPEEPVGEVTPPSGPEGKDLVTITNLNEMIKEADRANRVLSLLLGGIAAVSLLVGGIGIMNIMLVSVSERTEEIGLRKAVGAQRTDLLMQFLMEALLLSLSGGLLGLLLGNGVVGLVGRYDLEAVITLPLAMVSFCLALGVGVLFGAYPAWIASGLQPVQALRRQ